MTLIFCISQLIINANLNKKSSRLEQLNREKNSLIEKNRELQEEIAKMTSITVVDKLAEEKISLSDSPKVKQIYISTSNLVANASEN
ncbi:MAG TPA: hypothetical protein ENN64_01505 [bacterium]|nr:hypothetical protein [bacterium]